MIGDDLSGYLTRPFTHQFQTNQFGVAMSFSCFLLLGWLARAELSSSLVVRFSSAKGWEGGQHFEICSHFESQQSGFALDLTILNATTDALMLLRV